MKKKIDVLHIYYGTQGISGLYIDEIYQSLNKKSIVQEVIVSSYFPFGYGKRIFFKYTDLSSGIKNSLLRKVIRLMEMIFGLTYCFFFIILSKPKIVNYSLNSSFITDVIFLRAIKFFSDVTLIVTCHDVIPFSRNSSDKLRQINYRVKIFHLADFLLVHTKKSVIDLETFFNINISKIISHSFPIMSMKRVFEQSIDNVKKFDFAFVGHLRHEKGIEILVEAWKVFYTKNPNATLLIAGNSPYEMSFLDNLNSFNVVLDLEYLSDKQYFESICSARTIILPYKEGTNSGVVYNLIDLDVNIIYSNLPMFEENPLLDKKGMFESESIESLSELLSYFYLLNIENVSKTTEYKDQFDKEIYEVYSKLLYNDI